MVFCFIAPKAPSQANDQNSKDKPSETTEKKESTISAPQADKKKPGDDKVASFHISEHEFEGKSDNKQTSSTPAKTEEENEKPEEKTKEGEKNDWI
jgi:hypothetical protein